MTDVSSKTPTIATLKSEVEFLDEKIAEQKKIISALTLNKTEPLV